MVRFGLRACCDLCTALHSRRGRRRCKSQRLDATGDSDRAVEQDAGARGFRQKEKS
jgi:hypothetical protein